MTMNFQPSPHMEFSEAFQALLDRAMEAKQQAEPGRTYLGASRLGEECERMLAYEFHKTPKDADGHFPGKTLRVFDRGHDAETRMADYLRTAGFTLLTERPDGRQFGFYIAQDADGNARIAGHCDGIITAAPNGMAVPCLWEMKSLSNKSWSDTAKKGVKLSKPIYYAQMNLYMHHLELHENPALFTAINADTGEVYAELIEFDPVNVQVCIDRGARVVSTRNPNEAPRIAKDETFFKCRFCSYKATCWKPERMVAAVQEHFPGATPVENGWWGEGR